MSLFCCSLYIYEVLFFRVRATDGSDFLFVCDDDSSLEEWVKKISFHANLPPRMQLMSYDTQQQPVCKAGQKNLSFNIMFAQNPNALPTFIERSSIEVVK